ncbi:MAG: hypothetical protein A49_12920 [Methyloceanibacter sp.]|nr:MAG: hypothetical protein A49_12920 [Methyloceanibacter sp.]
MRYRRHFVFAGTRRQHLELAIDLHRVGIDDRSAEAIRERERRGRFAAGSRSGDENGVNHGMPQQPFAAAGPYNIN